MEVDYLVTEVEKVVQDATYDASWIIGKFNEALTLAATMYRIASKLYGLASIENKAFQDVKKPNNRFDLTITNVPFERITPTDLKHNKGGYSLHNYFINKMLNLTAPGALSMMITTSNTMDAVGAHLTEFAGKAQLVGAIRLPSGIYSSTQVATDILVFRKNIEGGKFTGTLAEEWTTAGEDETTGLTINNYFLKHPEMVAGKLEKITGRFGNEGLRVVGEGDLQENLERIAAAFPGKIVEREAVREAKSIDDIISAPGTVKEGGVYINDKDEVCLKENGEEINLPVATASEQKKAAIARGYVHLLDQVRTVLRAQKTEIDDAVVKAEQTKLRKFYDHFVKKFGPVNDPKNRDLYVDYTDSSWVLALEEYDPDTGKVTKIADIFTKNITGIASRPDRADTDHDALAMALDEFGYPGKGIAVYPVDVLVKNLIPDNNQLRNKRHFGGRTDLGDTLAESIAIGHGAKVRGGVPVDWIRAGEEKPSVKAYDEALSAHAYISPRTKPSLSAEEKTIRANAYGVKGMDPVVLDTVAKEMAALIPEGSGKSAILVPINNPIEQGRKVVKGTKGVGDLAKDVAGGAPVKLFQGFRPEPKLLYETLSGQSFFPDPMHPRPIRDTTEHILRTFSLDRIYNQVAGKPKQGGTWATQMYRDIQSLAFNESDPGEQAYYTSRKYIFDWLDKQGKEKPAAMPTNRSNSLYYYKQALKFGDFDAAGKYLKKYQGMGGKLHDVQGSIRRVHPLASLRLADRYKFKASLSPEQQETLSMATAWYKKHYVDTYQEQRKRGM